MDSPNLTTFDASHVENVTEGIYFQQDASLQSINFQNLHYCGDQFSGLDSLPMLTDLTAHNITLSGDFIIAETGLKTTPTFTSNNANLVISINPSTFEL